MNLEKYLDVSPEVAEALKAGKPVVALESTIISHGMPYPKNVETALNVEKVMEEADEIQIVPVEETAAPVEETAE